jgi:hypothetical protein
MPRGDHTLGELARALNNAGWRLVPFLLLL